MTLQVVSLSTAITFTNALCAEPSCYETEPNNTPADANPAAGAITLIGDLRGRDQDGYKWTVSDVDAQKRWNFELQGVPGRLTIVEMIRVDFADNGVDVTGKLWGQSKGTE